MFSNIEDMKNRGNVEWLFAFLQDYKDDSEKGWMARLDAAEALAQLGDPRGLDYLRQMAEYSNKDTREVALEILDELKDDPAVPIAQANDPALSKSNGLFFKINAKYPYVLGWAAFIVLYLIGVAILNSFGTYFLAITQTWLPEGISYLFLYSLFLVFGFLVFRYVIKIFILPYVNKS